VANKLTRDPQLEELVRELNEEGQSQPGNALEKLLTEQSRRGASDLLLIAGSPPVFRIDGILHRSEAAAMGYDDVQGLFESVISGRLGTGLAKDGSVDFSVVAEGRRFRVNLHRQRGTLAAAIRALPSDVPTLETLNLPAPLAELVKPSRGLVLICGPTGSGKSTTLAALVGEINRSEARHIITIEDPIEYEHRNAKSVIEQIEVGRDASSFAAALRASLRQDPDVILVGEMRDLETVATALTAAETGHLILSTLHTSDVMTAVHRIVDLFPPDQQSQVRSQLSLTLNAIVVQHLIPRSSGKGMAVAVELLLANQAVRNHIRQDKLQNLPNEITLGKRAGMIALEDSLQRLVQQSWITPEEARARTPG
jgi:twitching motility protein PilT